MAGKNAVEELSDKELMNELKSLGIKTGPVTPSTRKVLEKKLLKARGNDLIDSNHESEDSGKSEKYVFVEECTKPTRESTRSTSSVLESPAIFYGVCFDVDRSSSESASPSLTAISPAVFTSKDEALKMAKKVKGARFKGFKTKLEAESFARSRFQDQEQSPVPKDPVSSFKTPTPQKLVTFRTIIERGTKEGFQEVVLNNPRYLIGPGDTPVILQEGSRYNALHVAVKSNRKEMCQLIVETLESDHFWNILLNQETQSAINSKRKQFLVDMYLNTPDKGTWETPLHFACKYGHADIVEYLVSHPLTDIQRPNKYGETPAEVICSRCSSKSSELRSQIKSLLEDSFYIPLLGTMDNSTPPWIGGPWSPEISGDRMTTEGRFSGSALNTLKEGNSPGELPITVRAYAGPMSPSKAEELYHAWKSPSNREQRKSYSQIKRKDDSRGVERIGRDLAHMGGVAWTEYWHFLGCYTDLSNSRGLDKLEDYLVKKKEKVILSRLSVTPQRVRAVKSVSSVLKTPESRTSTIILNENGLRDQTEDKSDSDHFNKHDFSGSSLSLSRKVLFSDSELKFENSNIELKDLAHERKLRHFKQENVVERFIAGDDSINASLDETANSKTIKPVVDKLAQMVDTALSLDQEQDVTETILDVSLAEAPDKKDLLKGSFSSEVVDERDEVDTARVFPSKKKLFYNFSEASSDLFGSCDNDSSSDTSTETDEEMKVKFPEDKFDIRDDKGSLVFQNNTEKMLSSMQSQPLYELKKNILEDEVFENPSESDLISRKGDSTVSGDIACQNFKIPKNRVREHVMSGSCRNALGSGSKDISVFIHGLQPSKLDLDVFIAIGQVDVDAGKYPNIAQWKKLVMSYSEATQQSWPSPGSPRYHTRHKSLMWSC